MHGRSFPMFFRHDFHYRRDLADTFGIWPENLLATIVLRKNIDISFPHSAWRRRFEDGFMYNLGAKSKDYFFCKQFQKIQAYVEYYSADASFFTDCTVTIE